MKYSKYHPDNMDEKADIVLPPPVKNPEPRELYAELTERDRKIPGVYGHKLCAQAPRPTASRVHLRNHDSVWNRRLA